MIDKVPVLKPAVIKSPAAAARIDKPLELVPAVEWIPVFELPVMVRLSVLLPLTALMEAREPNLTRLSNVGTIPWPPLCGAPEEVLNVGI